MGGGGWEQELQEGESRLVSCFITEVVPRTSTAVRREIVSVAVVMDSGRFVFTRATLVCVCVCACVCACACACVCVCVCVCVCSILGQHIFSLGAE